MFSQGFPHLFRGSQSFPQLQGDARSDFDQSALGVGSQGEAVALPKLKIDDGNGWVAGGCWDDYPLVNIQKTMENHHF